MDPARVATLAQLCLAALPDSHLGLIDAECYRALPDFERLQQAEQSYVPGAVPAPQPTGPWLAFVFSKPSVDQGRLKVHVLEPTTTAGQGPGELWLKLKRAEVVMQLVEGARRVESAAAHVNQAILAWAEAQVSEPVLSIACEADSDVSDGPTWLRTPTALLRVGDRVTLQAPTLRTPVSAPARFAGMHYMKVISPSWALRTLRGR